ncbi:MAG: hypothetical protein ATN31_10975 [Candidatus Epulonipiscioides saccharophilum]|nr:MAG: hypothetical protein ATN31_10975 [Epulopiscium sp. AS2M-Bin001]
MFKIDTRQAQDKFNHFIELLDGIIANLEDKADEVDLDQLYNIKDSYKKKIAKFFAENQKLTIGVIGQVKAGKSSFLNTLLFDGQSILPSSSTPKTAILTKMEYATENYIEVEYYSKEEWNNILDNSMIDIEEEIFITARELVDMAKEKDLKISEYIGNIATIKFDTSNELIKNLSEYISEDGEYTAVVKNVNVYLTDEIFKGFTIVDAPGINDTIISRTVNTKIYLEECDIIFFLSPASSFLDNSDWELLFAQLPQKFVNKLVLIGSKVDSALRDILKVSANNEVDSSEASDNDEMAANQLSSDNNEKASDNLSSDNDEMDPNKVSDITEALEIINNQLRSRAISQAEKYEKEITSTTLLKAVNECKNPILVSSIIENMMTKSVAEYSQEEQNVYEAFMPFLKNKPDEFMRIANIDAAKERFKDVLMLKSELLTEKASSFLPKAINHVLETLANFKNKASLQSNILASMDKEQIMSQKQEISLQSTALKSALISIFGECFDRLETEKIRAVRDIRMLSKKYNVIQKSVGTQTKTKAYKVSASELLKPKTWGTSRTEYSLYLERYTYWSTSDVADSIRNYVFDVSSRIEYIFVLAIDPKDIKQKLLSAIVNYCNLSDEKYDATIFKMIVTETVSRIEFPLIRIGTALIINDLVSKFGGEVTTNSNKAALKQALFNSISTCYEEARKSLESEIVRFKNKLVSLQQELQERLMTNMNQEFNLLVANLENKDVEIDRQTTYIKQLTAECRKLDRL